MNKILQRQRKICIMGILNVTVDSFSDGGMYLDKEDAVEHAIKMEAEGADIIDVGAESTRPGASDVDEETEAGRVVPIIEKLSKKIRIPISIDTRKASVAEKSLKAGASIVNDVSGLNHDTCMAGIISKYGARVIVMHMKGTPRNMQAIAVYHDLIGEIEKSLEESITKAKFAGISEKNIIIDPGIGFGKKTEHNLEILHRLSEFKALGYPICVGSSRKSFIGEVLGLADPKDRSAGTIASCVIAAMNGADILRVHDVRQTVEAIKIVSAVNGIGAS